MKINRLLSLLSLLTTYKKMSANELAKRLEVSKRTIYRDIDTLNMAGIPIVSFAGIQGGFGILDGYKISKHVFSTNDLNNILVGLAAVQSIGNETDIHHLMTKIAPQMLTQATDSDILIDLSTWTTTNPRQEKIDTFRQAIAEKQLIEIHYHSNLEYTERKIAPHKLVFKSSFWYVYAFCQKRSAFRLFKLNRISSYKILEEKFEPQSLEALNLTLTYEDNCFNSTQSQSVEKIVLNYQMKDKAFLMDKLEATFFKGHEESSETGEIVFFSADLEKATDFVLRLQEKVKVVAPLALKEAVKEKITQLYQLYEC